MISNSSPLIFLAKINQLGLLEKLFGSIIITSDVRVEVLEDKKDGYKIIEKAIQEGWIKILDPENEVDFGIDKGENSSVNLARELKGTLIIDDADAIKIAKTFNIKILRTTTILLMSLKKLLIDKKQVKELLQRLIENEYYISSYYYSKLLKAVDDF